MPIIGQGVEVAGHSSGVVTTAGVQRCKSLAACPQCAEVGRRARAAEIDSLRVEAQSRGWSVWLVTATAAHDRRVDARDFHAAIQRGWSAAFSGKAAKRAGYRGQARAWDYTYGEHGWHPHLHALVFFDETVTVEAARAWVTSRYGAFQRSVMRSGYHTRRLVRDRVTGQLTPVSWDVRQVNDDGDTAVYVAGASKVTWNAAAEVAVTTSKRRSLTPWTILGAAVDGVVPRGSVISGWGPDRLWALWREYEAMTKGSRQIVVSRNLSRDLGVTVLDDDDDALFAGADGSEVVYVESFTASEWASLVTRGKVAAILERVERITATLLGDRGGG